MATETAPPADSAARPEASAGRANYALGLLTIISALNYADRGVLTLLLDSIKKDFRLTDTMLGLIAGFGFVLFYSFLGLPVARWADRFDRRFILTAGLVVWSAMTCFGGLARNVWQLAATRFGVGAGEACGVAPAHSMLSDLFPRGTLPRALSVLTAGSQLGIFFGSVLAGVVNQYYGWRMAFVAAGVPGIAVAILFRFTVKEPARGATADRAANTSVSSVGETARFLIQQRSFVFTTIGGSLMAFNIFGFQVWTPAFLHRVHHLSSGQIGTYVGTVMGLIGMAGVLLGGLLVEKLGKRDPRWGAYVPALACIFCSPLYLLFLFMPSVAGSLIFLLLAGILTRVYMGPTFAICQTVSKVRMRAVASAAFRFCGNLIGLGLGALLIGMLTDALRPRYGEDAIRYSLIAPCVIALVAGAFFWLAGRYLVADIQSALADGE